MICIPVLRLQLDAETIRNMAENLRNNMAATALPSENAD